MEEKAAAEEHAYDTDTVGEEAAVDVQTYYTLRSRENHL